MTYQENLLAHQNVLDGHTVTFISNSSKYVDGIIRDVGKQDLLLPDGMRLIRLKYLKIINNYLTSKIRIVKKLYQIIETIKPDIIFCHELASPSYRQVIKYIRKNPDVHFFVDLHTGFQNSGRNWLSLNVLHKMIYKPVYMKSVKYASKIFYVGTSEKEFALQVYKIPDSKLYFMPLGGYPFDDDEYNRTRKKYRKELGLEENELLLLHSGKMDALKNTSWLLSAFINTPNLKAKLVIIGNISQSIAEEIYSLIDLDKRIVFLGWKPGNELLNYLCAADIYCQPGSVSAILQNAICQRCAIMSYPHKTYLETIDMGQFIWVKNEKDIQTFLKRIEEKNVDIDILKDNSRKCGETILNYKNIAKMFVE